MFYELNYSKIVLHRVWFRVKCLKQGIKNRNSLLNRVGKSAIFCLKQGQGIRMRGWAASPAPKDIWSTPPPGCHEGIA